MFEHLAGHKKILVTGPHRSGTTIAATMIANDTGHGIVREELCLFRHGGVYHWATEVDAPLVIQAPFAADVCHQFPGICVVFMYRDIEDIMASRERAKNKNDSKVPWNRIDRVAMASYNTESPIDELKYENWLEQKKRISYPIDLEYESLRSHPLWIDKPFRRDFHVRQTNAVA